MIETIITGDLGVNTYLYNFKENLAVLIDPGSDADKIISKITESNLSLKGIILTHGHFDHIGAVNIIKKKYKVPVYIHKDDATFLGKEGKGRHKEMFDSMGPSGDYYFKSYYVENDSADHLLDDATVLNEFELKVIHTPGHSLGSICLYSKKNQLLFSGDTLFNGGLGRTDFIGGSYSTLIESLNKLKCLPKDTVVYPGHGEKTTISQEF